MKEAIVVIPIYNDHMTTTEQASFCQVRRILADYDMCFMAPDMLRGKLGKYGIRVEYWADRYFVSRLSYSQLCLESEFYERFVEYEFMLLYQLDAFVFANRLHDFCALGYDYIGAPLPFWMWRLDGHAHCGNGGFSLRRIESCKCMARRKDSIYELTGRGAEFEESEDMFYSYCGISSNLDFRVPDIDTSLAFCIEFDIKKCFSRVTASNLPFGVHAWSKYYGWQFWKPYISPYLDNTEAVEQEICRKSGQDFEELRFNLLSGYLHGRFFRTGKMVHDLCNYKLEFPGVKKVLLWGNGEIGKQAKALLKEWEIEVAGIIDSSAVYMHIENGIEVLPPEKIDWQDTLPYIIVSVSKPCYVEEIVSELLDKGLKMPQDFLTEFELERRLVMRYYNDFWQRYSI